MADILSRVLQRVSGTLGGQPAANPGVSPSLPSSYANPFAPSTPGGNPFDMLGLQGMVGNSLRSIDGRISDRAQQRTAQAAAGQAPVGGAFGASRPGGVDTGAPSSKPSLYNPGPDQDGNLGQWADLINRSSSKTGVPALAYAATIAGESGGDPTKINRSSGAVGLMQALPVAGRGGMHSTQELQDPNLQFQLAEPEFQSAYTKALREGWTGQQLIGATIAYAQRYERYADANGRYNPDSDTNQYFMGHVSRLWNQGHGRSLDANQLPSPAAVTTGVSQNDLGLDPQVAAAFCGPAAAIWFVRSHGREPTAQEALDLGKQVGWTQGNGMAGPASEVALLNRMGIPSRMEPVNWSSVASAASAGQPVILNTPGHYYQVTGHDPSNGKVRLGDAVGRGRWVLPQEIGGLGYGAPDYAIYADQPTSQAAGFYRGADGPDPNPAFYRDAGGTDPDPGFYR